MKISVASGKGGTGKTSFSLNFTVALADKEKISLLDCDVEDPNCHLFLRPEWSWLINTTFPTSELSVSYRQIWQNLKTILDK